jgi:hypothetical protein
MALKCSAALVSVSRSDSDEMLIGDVELTNFGNRCPKATTDAMGAPENTPRT